jgi:succinate dehydrogenase / fumarate reductase flavoprotein subunit/L-aspartate oxidase
MGNALLDIICFGRRAGFSAVKNRQTRGHKHISIDHISHLRRELMLNNMPMEKKSPILFPDYVHYDSAENIALRQASHQCGACDI